MQHEAQTYSGNDVLEFLSFVDSDNLGIDKIVSAVRSAGSNCKGAKVMAFEYCMFAGYSMHGDPAFYIENFEAMWDATEAAQDLRELAEDQLRAYEAAIFDMELSDNHELRVQMFTRERKKLIKAIRDWLSVSRTDELELRTNEKPWPVKLPYEIKHGAKNATMFLERCPCRLISSGSTLYSFENNRYVAKTDDQMAADVRATDPIDYLDVEHVKKLVTGLHQKTNVSAQPFEWIREQKCAAIEIAIYGWSF